MNIKNHLKHSVGFTVVELLVVIAIITIIPIIVMPNFSQIRLQFALSRVPHKFAQDVRKTQGLSLSSVTYKDSFGVEQAISGYGVYVDINNLGKKKYIIYADKSPSNNQYDSLDYIIETIDFSSSESGVIIKEINNVLNSKASIDFIPPNPDTKISSLSPNKSSVEIVFALESDLTKTRTVSVNISGLIEVK